MSESSSMLIILYSYINKYESQILYYYNYYFFRNKYLREDKINENKNL